MGQPTGRFFFVSRTLYLDEPSRVSIDSRMRFARLCRLLGRSRAPFYRSSPLVLVFLAVGCLSEPIGPALNQIDREPPPVTLQWVGRYVGTATGVFNQAANEDVAVEMVVTFDQPAKPDCAGCITVRIGEFFGRMNLLPQTAISAEWSYTLDSRVTTLTLNKFSSSASPGTVFFGTVEVETEATPESPAEILTSFDFVVERQ